jgi:hypothetical protein
MDQINYEALSGHRTESASDSLARVDVRKIKLFLLYRIQKARRIKQGGKSLVLAMTIVGVNPLVVANLLLTHWISWVRIPGPCRCVKI